MPDDVLSQLRTCEIFSDLDDEVLTLIAPVVEHRRFGPGDALFRAHQPRDALFVILAGNVEVSVEAGDAAGTVVILGAGDAVGEAGLLEPGLHSASAFAAGAVEALALPVEAARERLATDSRAAMALFAAVSHVMVRRLQYASFRRSGWDLVYRPGATRTEHDLLGDRHVPADAKYGLQTLRAVENFPITGIPIAQYPQLINGLAAVKEAAAEANRELGLLDEEIADAIIRAAREVRGGRLHGEFVVDVIQGGAGTSTNMNANEVIANRALELLGRSRGDYDVVHPNNHVNLSQSTNDAYPTALKIAAIWSLRDLEQAVGALRDAFLAKGDEFADIVKMGRTQLQDAVPMTLGQEFKAFGVTLGEEVERLREAGELIREINMGATAIGTGINTDPGYADAVRAALSRITGLELVTSPDLVEATQDTGVFVHLSGTLKRLAVKLSKISNDLRLLSSGPRAGLREIRLPPMQPGSSIMPGKVNPVIPEVVNQVAFQVIGNDLTVTMAAEGGQLQLNVFEPVIAFNIFQSVDMLIQACIVLRERTVVGVEADRERIRELLEHSIGVVTALVPYIGYEKASAAAREALESDRGVYELVLEKGWMSRETLDRVLSPDAMTRPRDMPGR